MGNDGGSIPKRRELVKEAAQKPTTAQLKETQQEQQEYQWATCPLSHKVLKLPVVSDSSGKLYNKDAIIEFLLPDDGGRLGLSKADGQEVLQGRVNSLRDVVEVKFNTVEDGEGAGRGEVASPRDAKWVCPITNKVLGAGVKAVYLVPCGHAFTESAVKEVSSENCLQCNEPFTIENVINILPTSSADKERLSARALKLKDQGLSHSLKKAPGSGKKRKKNGESVLALTVQEESSTVTNTTEMQVFERKETPKSSSAIKNAATASLTAKVLAEEQERAKKRKKEPNENLKSLFSSSSGKHKDGDFMTRGFSIPTDAKR